MDNNYNQGNGQNGYDSNNYNQNGYDPNNYNQNGYVPQYDYNNMNNKKQGQGSSIAAMVCGILGIVFCWCYGIVGLILSIVALVLYGRAKRLDGGLPSGMAKAGMICGIIGVILSTIALIYYILIFIGVAGSALYWL